MSKVENTENTSGRDEEHLELSNITGGSVKWHNGFETLFGIVY